MFQDTPEGVEFPDYIAAFNEIYPGIAVTVEGIERCGCGHAAKVAALQG